MDEIIKFFKETLPNIIEGIIDLTKKMIDIQSNIKCATKTFGNFKKCLVNYLFDMIFLEITIILALLSILTYNFTIICLTIVFALITTWSMADPGNAIKNYILYPLDKSIIFFTNTYNQAKYDFLVGYNIIISIMNDAIFSKYKNKCQHKPKRKYKEGLTELNSTSSKPSVSKEFAQSKPSVSTEGFDGDFLGISGYFTPIDNPRKRVLIIPDDAYFIRTNDDIDKCYCFTAVNAYFNPLKNEAKYDIGGRITSNTIFIYIYISQLLEELLFGKKCKRRK
jgi:hypothetical protein